jgi:MscS family membrane protein
MALLLFPLIAHASGDQNLLEPLDTSSPRATFESFLTNVNETARLYYEYRNSPSKATYDTFIQVWHKGIRLLDLSQVAPAAHIEIADETRRLLAEVIARVELPELREIPDSVELTEREQEHGPLKKWRLPGTEITIVRVEEGVRAGEYLFSSDTIVRAREFYELVKDLPPLRPVPTGDFIRNAELFTGWLIPQKWVEELPGWANTTVFGMVLWKWFALLLLYGLAAGIVFRIYRWSRNCSWDGSLQSYLRRLSTPVAILALVQLLRHVGFVQISFSGPMSHLPEYLLRISRGIAVIWSLWLTLSWVAEVIIASPKISSKSLDAHMIRLVVRSVALLAILVLLFAYAHEIGIPAYGLVAGAGVGGIAIALAARNTLENFMGTIDLYVDRPIRVGDLCRFDEESNPQWRPVGRVESIGLRSTKIRRFDRSLITIPNGKFAQLNIVNLSRCDRFLMKTTLGLRYETSLDQLRFVLGELRTLLHAHPKVIHTAKEPVRVRFIGYGDYSLNIELCVYIRTSIYNEFLAIQEDILLRIGEILEQAGTAFAFPSRTVYQGNDTGLDKERQEYAEKKVSEWSAAHSLPFPDIAEDRRKEITDTLDYPPEGSPASDA